MKKYLVLVIYINSFGKGHVGSMMYSDDPTINEEEFLWLAAGSKGLGLAKYKELFNPRVEVLDISGDHAEVVEKKTEESS